jgi:hypothetical protein
MADETLTPDEAEIAGSTNAGRDRFLQSLRRVLQRHGYNGQALEAKIVELMQKDVSRLAAVIARPILDRSRRCRRELDD